MYENINMITCGMVNCFVLRGDSGDILIDTGREEYRDYIAEWLKNYNIRLIILTHGHSDHIGNAGFFSALYGAPVMISPYDVRLARDNNSRPYYITSPLGFVLKTANSMSMRIKTDPFDPKIYAEEGMDLKPYGVDGVVIELEGHTKGSVGVLCKSSVGYDLYAGDAVMNTPLSMRPMICESPKRAINSMKRIISLAPDRILCGHGSPVCRGTGEYKRLTNMFAG